MWTELKKCLNDEALDELHQFCQEEWARIPTKFWKKVVEGDDESLNQVNVTKYKQSECKPLTH